jgi:hypothetical protein
MNKPPSGYLNDYFVGRGSSSNSKSAASQLAFENAISSIIKNHSITVDYTEQNTVISEQTLSDQNNSMEIVRRSAQELNLKGESKIIKGLKEVETYYEWNSNIYEAWVLISFPKKNPISPPNSFSPVWRSFLLPGWGQLYKNQSFKGVSFMTLTLSGVAGGFVFNILSNDATNKAVSARTQARRDFFNSEAKNFNTYSTISFIAAGVFYAWNLVDAIIVKQDNLYVILEDGEIKGLSFIVNF